MRLKKELNTKKSIEIFFFNHQKIIKKFLKKHPSKHWMNQKTDDYFF